MHETQEMILKSPKFKHAESRLKIYSERQKVHPCWLDNLAPGRSPQPIVRLLSKQQFRWIKFEALLNHFKNDSELIQY